MRMDAVVLEAIRRMARMRIDSRTAGLAVLAYSALLLTASLLLATSWVPLAFVGAAALLCVTEASAGLALLRRSVGRHAIVATCGGLHVVVLVAWIVLLFRA